MVYKPRTESEELLSLKSLNNRSDLADKDKQYYLNLKKGFEGEVIFDSLVEQLQCECLILNDLLLKHNNTTFQIDSLLICPETIYFFEVKNFEGDYYFESDKLYKKPKYEIVNPILQLNRSESLLRQLLQNLGFTYPIEAWVIFINPDFTLYQAPLQLPFIFPSQIHRYLDKLNTNSSKLTEKHKRLAQKLVSLQISDSSYSQIPSYQYDHLRKGITCEKCCSFSILVAGKKCVCQECWHEELVAHSVLRSVGEFQRLFPDKKITTNLIFDWCKVVSSKKRIERLLAKNFEMVGGRRWAFYQ